MHDEKVNLNYDLASSNLKVMFAVNSGPLGNDSIFSYIDVQGIISDNTVLNPETNEFDQQNIFFPIEECSEDQITEFFKDEGVIDTYPAGAYLCIDQEIILKRTNRSIGRRDLHISILKCVNSTNSQWKTDQEIDNYIASAELLFLLKNNYFEFNNIKTPIKQFFKENRINVGSNIETYVKIGVKNNEYVLKDTLTQFTQEEGSFYSFSYIDTTYHADIYRIIYGQVAFITFEIDNEFEIYERSVYSLWEYIGQIGGIYEIVEVFTAFIVTTYNGKMFMLNLVNDKIKILASHSENRIISMNKPNSDRMLNEDEKQNEAEGNQEEVSVDNIDISRSRQDTKIHPKLFTISDAIKSFGWCKWSISKKIRNYDDTINQSRFNILNFNQHCNEIDKDLDFYNILGVK